MEVVIAVIVLLGALALGHSTADQEAAEVQARLVRDDVVESLYDDAASQGCRYRVDGPVQRDLTLPYARYPSSVRAGSREKQVSCCSD